MRQSWLLLASDWLRHLDPSCERTNVNKGVAAAHGSSRLPDHVECDFEAQMTNWHPAICQAKFLYRLVISSM